MNYTDAKIAMRALNLDGGEGSRLDYSEEQARDPNGRWVASGRTYENKEHLKHAGFEFNAAHKIWVGGTAAKDKLELGMPVGPRGQQITVRPKGLKIETTKEYNERNKQEIAQRERASRSWELEKEVAENKAAYENVFGKY